MPAEHHDHDEGDGDGLKPFSEWLAKQRDGALDEELAIAMRDVVTAVKALGKPGKLTVTFDINTKGYSLVIVDDVKLKVPEADREWTVWFQDQHGNLRRDNPAQPPLFGPGAKVVDLTIVPDGKAAASGERYDPATGEIL